MATITMGVQEVQNVNYSTQNTSIDLYQCDKVYCNYYHLVEHLEQIMGIPQSIMKNLVVSHIKINQMGIMR